jgi:hypothetical protein
MVIHVLCQNPHYPYNFSTYSLSKLLDILHGYTANHPEISVADGGRTDSGQVKDDSRMDGGSMLDARQRTGGG